MQNCQCGRSMLEMLGVLSIIGVLSIGGLSGYSKMVKQQRVNASMQQINIISAKISAAGAQTKSYSGLDNASASRFNAIPSEMMISGDGSLTNPFGGSVEVSSSNLTEAGDELAYYIKYSDIPEDACVDLVSRDWNSSQNSSLLGIGVGDVQDDIYQGCTGSDNVACQGDFPMSMNSAAKACNCGDNCTVVFKFF